MSRKEEFEMGKTRHERNFEAAPEWWQHPTTPEMVDEMKWEQGKLISKPEDHTTNKADTPPF